jgi:hypothetical protein
MIELAEQAEELKGDLGLLKPENLTHSTARADEFPRVSEGGRPVSEKAAVTLVPDPDWPNIWCVRLPNGQLTDMVNLTRAKDAARPLSRRHSDGLRDPSFWSVML